MTKAEFIFNKLAEKGPLEHQEKPSIPNAFGGEWQNPKPIKTIKSAPPPKPSIDPGSIQPGMSIKQLPEPVIPPAQLESYRG